MSHKIYQTEGIIIKSEDRDESDKILSIFTKDFGRIEIFAKGVRKINSKLRPHLNLLDYSRLAFVAGKKVLRIVDAEKISSWQNLPVLGVQTKISESFIKLESVARMISFLERMLKGQEKNIALWNFLIETLSYLNSEVEDKKDIVFLEKLFFLRVLFFLGYVDLNKIPENFSAGGLSKKLLSECGLFSNDIAEVIKKGIKASQM